MGSLYVGRDNAGRPFVHSSYSNGKSASALKAGPKADTWFHSDLPYIEITGYAESSVTESYFRADDGSGITHRQYCAYYKTVIPTSIRSKMESRAIIPVIEWTIGGKKYGMPVDSSLNFNTTRIFGDWANGNYTHRGSSQFGCGNTVTTAFYDSSNRTKLFNTGRAVFTPKLWPDGRGGWEYKTPVVGPMYVGATEMAIIPKSIANGQGGVGFHNTLSTIQAWLRGLGYRPTKVKWFVGNISTSGGRLGYAGVPKSGNDIMLSKTNFRIGTRDLYNSKFLVFTPSGHNGIADKVVANAVWKYANNYGSNVNLRSVAGVNANSITWHSHAGKFKRLALKSPTTRAYRYTKEYKEIPNGSIRAPTSAEQELTGFFELISPATDLAGVAGGVTWDLGRNGFNIKKGNTTYKMWSGSNVRFPVDNPIAKTFSSKTISIDRSDVPGTVSGNGYYGTETGKKFQRLSSSPLFTSSLDVVPAILLVGSGDTSPAQYIDNMSTKIWIPKKKWRGVSLICLPKNTALPISSITAMSGVDFSFGGGQVSYSSNFTQQLLYRDNAGAVWLYGFGMSFFSGRRPASKPTKGVRMQDFGHQFSVLPLKLS